MLKNLYLCVELAISIPKLCLLGVAWKRARDIVTNFKINLTTETKAQLLSCTRLRLTWISYTNLVVTLVENLCFMTGSQMAQTRH